MLRKLALSALLAACLVPFAAAKDKEKFQASDAVRLDREGDKWARKTLKKMSLEQKIGQLIMIWCRAEFLNVKDPEYIRMRDTMQKYHIGGFGMTVRVDGPFLLRNQPYEAAMLLNQLQRESELPLMFAADFERGLSMRLHGTTVFPHAMAFGADGSLADAEAFGRINAKEARAIGVQWNWFPDADVNSNPANPIINTRSFGEDPKQVGALVSAYIKGAHEGGMLTTAKHYPGHGDTATDSHLGLAAVEGDINRLDSIELPPFQDAINAGVDAIMVAHVTVKALEPDPKRVATTSSAVVTDLLKKKMGFQGLVVTDALDMNGLMRLYSGTPGVNASGAAAVAALKAGNDMILIPGDIGGTYNGMLNAVQSGEIPLSQIDESVLKVLRAKASVGLNRARLVDVDNMKEVIATPEDIATGQRIAEAAVTLVRDNGDLLPLKRQPRGTPEAANPYLRVDQSRNRTVAVIFSDEVRSENGRVFERELHQRVPEARIVFVDPRIAGGMTEQIMQAVGEAQAVIVPVYAIPSAGRVIALQDATTNLMQRILQAAPGRTVVIALGNPYIARDFPAVQNYLCTFSNATVSELAAVKALFGEIAIRGKLPVTIPQVAQRGTGIERGAQTAQQGRAKDASSKTAAAP